MTNIIAGEWFNRDASASYDIFYCGSFSLPNMRLININDEETIETKDGKILRVYVLGEVDKDSIVV